MTPRRGPANGNINLYTNNRDCSRFHDHAVRLVRTAEEERPRLAAHRNIQYRSTAATLSAAVLLWGVGNFER